MTMQLLVDAAHPEETRVVVIKGNSLEDFDYASSTKIQLRGNIYLAKVSVTLMTRPQHPEVQAVVPTAIGVVTIFLLYVLQRAAMPRLSAVSLSTLKSETAQPLFVVMMLSTAEELQRLKT